MVTKMPEESKQNSQEKIESSGGYCDRPAWANVTFWCDCLSLDPRKKKKSIIALLAVLGLTQHRLSALQKTNRSKYNTYSKMRWTVLVTDILHQSCYTGEHLSWCLTTHLNALHCTVCLFIFSGGCKVVMKKWNVPLQTFGVVKHKTGECWLNRLDIVKDFILLLSEETTC